MWQFKPKLLANIVENVLIYKTALKLKPPMKGMERPQAEKFTAPGNDKLKPTNLG